MRSNKNRCPKCKASVERNFQYCLACGYELPTVTLSPQQLAKAAKAQERAYQRGKVDCWQCGATLAQPTPFCPDCGADLSDQKGPVPKREVYKPSGPFGIPRSMLISVVLAVLVLAGGIGYMSFGGGGRSSASDAGFEWPSLPDFLGGGDSGPDFVRPDGVAVEALEGQASKVNDDGTIDIRVGDDHLVVSLAGIKTDFVTDCLGETALARLRRIVPNGTTVYVVLDGEGTLIAPESESDEEPVAVVKTVYLWSWSFEDETEEIRFANQELLASGEAGYVDTLSTGTELSKDVVSAAARARTNERGMFESGACK